MKRSKKIDINQIVEDFTDKLIKGEKITIDEVLKKYPQERSKLRPLLEASEMLVKAGDEITAKTDKELAKFDNELWQKLEKNILTKNLKEVEKCKRVALQRDMVELKKRFEYILLLLYVKGYHCRIGEGIRGITRFIKSLFLISKMTDYAKLIKLYYEFVPYKLGPFDPAIYQDLKVLEIAGIIKRHPYKYKRPPSEAEKIDEGFGFNDESTIFTLTEEGMKYAQALARWCDKKDRKILEDFRRIKTTYGSAPLKKLLKYIYENYPEYTKESEVLEEILK
ncbi:MAG: hypothetical protein ABIK31_06545 [candidate division WOR-3 bacterium]